MKYIYNLWQNNWSDNDASHNNCAEISILMNYKLISYVACIIVPETGEIMKLIELVLVRSVTSVLRLNWKLRFLRARMI